MSMASRGYSDESRLYNDKKRKFGKMNIFHITTTLLLVATLQILAMFFSPTLALLELILLNEFTEENKMVKTIIQTENMSYTYPDGTSAIKDINIEINEGERVAIVGSNGAGKSTLFAHFNGIIKPSLGLIKINEKPASL